MQGLALKGITRTHEAGTPRETREIARHQAKHASLLSRQISHAEKPLLKALLHESFPMQTYAVPSALFLLSVHYNSQRFSVTASFKEDALLQV